ncbi:sugar nucleotide-binding protein [Streptomyces sp. NPDC101225]|uniref:sugar nucleotide-binding protein n=1 Tax=Streptomyces sp. NPDC101225 TaxID=3366135 RepID=UPI003806150F
MAGLDGAARDVARQTDVRHADVRETPAGHRPDLVAHRAAYTAVGGAPMIHVATEDVPAGDASTPYGQDHPTASRTAHGRTEPAGGRAAVKELPTSTAIVRTAWLHGVHGRSFVRTMIDPESRRDTLDVVEDQRGQPTWSADVAARLADLGPWLGRGVRGVFHATSPGEAGRYEPARTPRPRTAPPPPPARRSSARRLGATGRPPCTNSSPDPQGVPS